MEGDKKKKKGLFSIPSLNEMKEASKISTDGNKLSLFRAGRKDSEPVEPIPPQQTVDLDRAVRKGPLQASANRARTSNSVTASNHGSVSAGDVVRGLGAEAQRKTLTKWSERSEESGKLQCRSEGIAKEGKRPNIYTDTDSGGTSTSEETFSRATSSATDRPSGSATDRPSGSATDRSSGSTADGRRGSATHGPSGSETHRPSDSATHRPSGCAADGPSGSATDRPNSSEAAGTTVAGVTYNPHAIIINPIQKNNPVMKQIRNVPWEMGNIVPDFVLGRSTCALFLSVRYHSLHPNYIHSRLKELGKQYELRILLVLADMSECQKVLHELAKIAILADLTLIVAWSYDEAGRYLETYKAYENKSPDQLMERVDSDFSSRVTESLTTVKKVNKTDAATLLNTFKTMEKIVTASKEELSLCPGLGPQKAQRLHDLFHEPFIRPKKSRLEE